MDFNIGQPRNSRSSRLLRSIPNSKGLVRPSDLISDLQVNKYFLNPNYETDEHSDYNFTAGDPLLDTARSKLQMRNKAHYGYKSG